MEYGKILSGELTCVCCLTNFKKFIDLVRADECPSGYLLIEKDESKPEPEDGKVIWFRYEAIGGVLKKHYFYAPAPRQFSKLKLYLAITNLNAWPAIQSWLESKTINGVNGWMAFQLAQDVSEDHPLFAALAEEARNVLGLDKDQFEEILSACVL